MTAVGGMAISRALGITKLADRQPLQSLYEGIILEKHKARNHIVSVTALVVYHVEEFVPCFLKRNKIRILPPSPRPAVILGNIWLIIS